MKMNHAGDSAAGTYSWEEYFRAVCDIAQRDVTLKYARKASGQPCLNFLGKLVRYCFPTKNWRPILDIRGEI